MIGLLLTGAAVVLVVFALLAPLESLRWWTRRGAVEARRTFELVGRSGETGDDAAPAPAAERYVVFLTGVGIADASDPSPRERELWERVRQALPGSCVIDEVFPYAVDNRGLLQRTSARLWERLLALRTRRPGSLAPNLINLRNVLQVLVSADPRYGPTYNTGTALQIWGTLHRHGFRPGRGIPVTLVGYSGGAQVAIGSASLLAMLDVPVSVVSIGGVFGDDPGLDHVRELWDLRGERDWIRRIGPVAFPGRWPLLRGSTWWRAVRENRVHVVGMGPLVHDGDGSYWDPRPAAPGQDAPADRLLAELVRILR